MTMSAHHGPSRASTRQCYVTTEEEELRHKTDGYVMDFDMQDAAPAPDAGNASMDDTATGLDNDADGIIYTPTSTLAQSPVVAATEAPAHSAEPDALDLADAPIPGVETAGGAQTPTIANIMASGGNGNIAAAELLERLQTIDLSSSWASTLFTKVGSRPSSRPASRPVSVMMTSPEPKPSAPADARVASLKLAAAQVDQQIKEAKREFEAIETELNVALRKVKRAGLWKSKLYDDRSKLYNIRSNMYDNWSKLYDGLSGAYEERSACYSSGTSDADANRLIEKWDDRIAAQNEVNEGQNRVIAQKNNEISQAESAISAARREQAGIERQLRDQESRIRALEVQKRKIEAKMNPRKARERRAKVAQDEIFDPHTPIYEFSANAVVTFRAPGVDINWGRVNRHISVDETARWEFDGKAYRIYRVKPVGGAAKKSRRRV